MKTKLTKTPILRSKWHYGVAISAFVFLVFLALTPSAAQQKNSKRITGVRLGTASEGSRVSVFSDTALSDYEAFRRGDRFYVRIPAAHFLVPQPQFRGAGFQHVQVQKIGDSIVISFWLQPGASAYVEQHATKLDIVFGSAGGANPAGTGATTGSPTQAPAQTGQAGPISPASRNESVTRSATQSPNTQLPSNAPTSTGATDQNSSVTSQTDPLTSASPASTAGVPLSSSTPAPHAYAQPAKRDWRNSYVMQWYRLNQKVAIAAAILILIALALLVWWLVARIRRRPKPQPKVVAKDLVKSKTATAPVMAPVKARPQQESLEPVSVSERPNLRVVEKPKPAPDAEEREAFIEFVDGMKLRDSALPLTAESLATPPSPAAPSVPPVPSLQKNLAAEEERLLQEEEALRRAADELENRKREAEIAIRVKQEARLKAETEAQLRAEVEARIRAEEEARIRTEHEERVRLETAARLRAEDEARFQQEAQTLRRAAEELARKRAEAEAVRKLAEEEARRQAEEEMRRKVEEEMRRRAEEEARLKAEHELKLRLEEESLAEAEARRLAEEEPVRVEREAEARGLAEEVRIKAEAEAEIRRQVEEARRLAEEQRLLDEERLRREAEERRVVEARRLLMEQEALTQAAAELVRRRAEIEESRKQAEEEARLLAETRERVQAEAEAARRRVAEERERLEAEANRRVEEEHQKLEEARRLAEEKHRQIEEATRLQAREEEQRLMELEALRKKSEEESRRRAEQERRIRSEIDALHRAEEEQRRRIEVETQRRIELEARLKEEHARQQAEDVARLKAQEETRRLAEEARARAEEETKHNDASLERNERVELPALPDDVDKESENQAVATPVMEHLAQTKDIEAIHKEKGIIPVDGESGIPAELIEKFNAQESSERAAALTDIARYGSDDAFHHISKAFDDQSPDVRNAAARALYSLHPDRAASFTRALREGTSERRRRIGSALAASGLASDAIANLTGESRERTYDAFSLLFLMAKAGEVQPLVKAIEDYPNIEVRLAVVKLLALSGQPEIVPAFRRLAVRASLPAEVRSAVMEAIYQISTQTRESASSAA